MRNLNNSPKPMEAKDGTLRHQSSNETSSSRVGVADETSRASSSPQASNPATNSLIVMTPYPVEQGHKLITIVRMRTSDWKPEMRSTASFIAEGDNAGIIINKPASIMDYNKTQAGQKERQQPPSARMSFKVFLMKSDTNKLTPEHRTLRFWLDHSPVISVKGGQDNWKLSGDTDEQLIESAAHNFNNMKQESSQLAQAFFYQLIGYKQDDFPKDYTGFFLKLMRLLKSNQFARLVRIECELRQLAPEDQVKPASPVSSIGGTQSGRGSPLTSQKVLDIIESSYPNPVSVRDICSLTQTDEALVRQFVDELVIKEKINSTDDDQNFTRVTKPIDTKVNMVKHMPRVQRAQQPVIAIITAKYCEKLAVDSMISDKETFVRYRVSSGQDNAQNVESSSNYVYTLGNIADHRVVSTKLTSIGHSTGATIAAGNATTRLLGTFPEIEHVFLVGCAGGVPDYTDFASHVRLGDVVISHLPNEDSSRPLDEANLSRHNNYQSVASRSDQSNSSSDFVYVHCQPKQNLDQTSKSVDRTNASIPASCSIRKNLKKVGGESGIFSSTDSQSTPEVTDLDDEAQKSVAVAKGTNKKLTYEECRFRLWRPAVLELQQLAQRLWLQGLENAHHRIWEHYIDEGIATLKQQDIEAARPSSDSDKLYMSIGLNDTIEVNHPEAGDSGVDLRREGRPMCHFGPIGSGRPALTCKELKQQMISEFGLRAFDSEFDSVVESIHGSCKGSFILIRGISDYEDGNKKKEWQQYSALAAATFMKSIIVNLKPTN